MKTIVKPIYTFLALSLIWTTPLQAVESETLESSLNELVSPVVQDTLLLKDLKASINHENSNVEKGALEGLIELETVSLTSNQKQPITGSLSVQTDLKQKTSEDYTFSLLSDFELNLDTVSVLKYASSVFGDCEIKDNDHTNNLICIFIKGANQMETATDLAPVFIELKTYAIDAFESSDQDGLIDSLRTLEISQADKKVYLNLNLNLPSFGLQGLTQISLSDQYIDAEVKSSATVNEEDKKVYEEMVLNYATELTKNESSTYINLQSNLYLIFGFLEAFLYDYEQDGM